MHCAQGFVDRYYLGAGITVALRFTLTHKCSSHRFVMLSVPVANADSLRRGFDRYGLSLQIIE
jgi:hypothetical protein